MAKKLSSRDLPTTTQQDAQKMKQTFLNLSVNVCPLPWQQQQRCKKDELPQDYVYEFCLDLGFGSDKKICAHYDLTAIQCIYHCTYE